LAVTIFRDLCIFTILSDSLYLLFHRFSLCFVPEVALFSRWPSQKEGFLNFSISIDDSRLERHFCDLPKKKLDTLHLHLEKVTPQIPPCKSPCIGM
jgi:hypothetical protein